MKSSERRFNASKVSKKRKELHKICSLNDAVQEEVIDKVAKAPEKAKYNWYKDTPVSKIKKRKEKDVKAIRLNKEVKKAWLDDTEDQE